MESRHLLFRHPVKVKSLGEVLTKNRRMQTETCHSHAQELYISDMTISEIQSPHVSETELDANEHKSILVKVLYFAPV